MPYEVEAQDGGVRVSVSRPLTPSEARDMAQALLAAADEALGAAARYPVSPPA